MQLIHTHMYLGAHDTIWIGAHADHASIHTFWQWAAECEPWRGMFDAAAGLNYARLRDYIKTYVPRL